MALLVATVMSVCSLTGCGAGAGNAETAAQETAASQAEAAASETAAPETAAPEAEERYSVVCTIFPAYDWVRQVLGERAEQVDLTLLLDNGVDLHNYQPTAEDIVKIGSCDLFVYVGGESDDWVEDALKEASNPDRKVVNLLESIGDGAKEEELVEGMEGEEEEEGVEEEEGPEYDEHVWLSLRNAQTLTQVLTDAMKEIDSANADTYQTNCDSYTAQLAQLDGDYQAAVEGAGVKTLLFGDRFPFRYLVDDYGLSYYAAFVGCSAETEASFETVVFLAGKVDELGLNTICTIENSDQRIAQTIIDNTTEKNQSILTMDSLQSTTMQDVNSGATYLSAMEQNLETLKQVLQ